MKVEKKAYRRPQFVEYGRLAEVTLGNNGCTLDSGHGNNGNGSGSHGGPPSCLLGSS